MSMILSGFPFFRQLDYMDCGPTCLRMVAKYFGANYSIEYLRNVASLSRQGVNLLGLKDAANEIKLKTLISEATIDQLKRQHILPAILFWGNNHFVVLYKIKKKTFSGPGNSSVYFYVADPAFGKIKLNEKEFTQKWLREDQKGVVCFFEPAADFWEYSKEKEGKAKPFFLLSYLKDHRLKLWIVLLLTLATSLVNLFIPVVTQKIVDKGIPQKDIGLILLMLFFQIAIFVGLAFFDYIKSKLLFFINSLINLEILSTFLKKLLVLPLRFFDNKVVSDISQRIADHHRIEKFLTSNTITILFSIFNFIFFSALIIKYQALIFVFFFVGGIISFVWLISFLKRRAFLDYQRFDLFKSSSTTLFDVINGMKEIKLNNAEGSKIEEWSLQQNKIQHHNFKVLRLDQVQQVGNGTINQIKNISITFYSAILVIKGNITFGEMLSIGYITGQLNAPFAQLYEFVKNYQEARMSYERIAEVNARLSEDEESNAISPIDSPELRNFKNISIRNLTFSYERNQSSVIRNVSLHIERGKVIAFVGNSGSGKTTLIKLLLKFYLPESGSIMIDNHCLNNIPAEKWRSLCGAVLQDGFIFSNTIAKNIALSSKDFSLDRVKKVCRLANIDDFIESLPQKYGTQIGDSGMGLSGGQIQRILIARALYKNPEIVLFDEATSSLDTENERIIMNNLFNYSQGKTLIIVAHRLSTVKNADVIYVFDKGRVVEFGNHHELISEKGNYYNLIVNQLELSS